MLADKQAQKGMVPGYAAKSCIVCTQMEPGALVLCTSTV